MHYATLRPDGAPRHRRLASSALKDGRMTQTVQRGEPRTAGRGAGISGCSSSSRSRA